MSPPRPLPPPAATVTPPEPTRGPPRQFSPLPVTGCASDGSAPGWPTPAPDPYAALRSHGGRAHQLRTSLHAANHYLARGRQDERADDRATAIWLVACSLNLAAELSTGLHRLNKRMRTQRSNPDLQPTVSAMRRQACQLHAMARATAHFLAQPGRSDMEVGGWLIVTARRLAQDLAADIDNHCTASNASALAPLSDEREQVP